jgi:glycosyltransferase involved in cell wall biosynthesis
VYYLEHPAHQNCGMSASRNLGIRQAQGEYVAFLDADDVWLPQKLWRQAALLEAHPEVALVYGSSLWWHSWTGNPADIQRDFRDYVEVRGVTPNAITQPPELLTAFLRDGGAVPCPSAVLARRDAVLQVGGFEEAFRDLYEDQAFYAKMLLHYPTYVEAECWALYRQHPASTCAVAERENQVQSARLAWLNWLERYLAEQQVQDGQLQKALRQALLPYRHATWYHLSVWVRRQKEVWLYRLGVLTRQVLPTAWYAWLKAKKQRSQQAASHRAGAAGV